MGEAASDRIVPRLIGREPPLAPEAAVAGGRAARALVERLLASSGPRGDAAGGRRLERLSGVASADRVILLGAPEALPWVDGVGYLGREPEAPALYLPTTLRPSVPAAILFDALRRARPGLKPPFALLGESGPLVALGVALPLERHRLEAWLARAAP